MGYLLGCRQSTLQLLGIHEADIQILQRAREVRHLAEVAARCQIPVNGNHLLGHHSGFLPVLPGYRLPVERDEGKKLSRLAGKSARLTRIRSMSGSTARRQPLRSLPPRL